MKERNKPGGNTLSVTEIRKSSFEKETNAAEHESKVRDADEEGRRSLMGAPVDPNSPTTKGNFPPGLPAGDAIDPGRATPGAKSVDNRSGEAHKDEK